MRNARIFVEKKPGFQVEADSLKATLNQNFNLNIRSLRHLKVYDIFNIEEDLLAKAEKIGKKFSIPLKFGVYVGTQGPTFETLAEYRYFRIIGGDSCGMSTVPEVIVANHAGMSVFGVSVISNVGVDANLSNVTHEEVQQNTLLAQENLAIIFTEMVKACV